MRTAIIGFVVGIAWLQTQAALPSYSVLLCLSALIVPAVWSLRRIETPWLRMLVLSATGAAAGFAWAALLASHTLSEQLPAEWEGRDVTVIGTIDSLPDTFERGVRFHFRVEKVLPIDGLAPPIPSRVALSWYAGFEGREAQTIGDVHAGERWQLSVRLRKPHGNANPQTTG